MRQVPPPVSGHPESAARRVIQLNVRHTVHPAPSRTWDLIERNPRQIMKIRNTLGRLLWERYNVPYCLGHRFGSWVKTALRRGLTDESHPAQSVRFRVPNLKRCFTCTCRRQKFTRSCVSVGSAKDMPNRR